jgi:hypothetical protein
MYIYLKQKLIFFKNILRLIYFYFLYYLKNKNNKDRLITFLSQ